MGLDEIERKVELLERAMDEVERLSRAMQAGMAHHYARRSADEQAEVGDQLEESAAGEGGDGDDHAAS